METKEIERLVAIEERCKSNTHRIDSLEALAKAINEQSKSIAELVLEVKHTNERLGEQAARLDVIEREPRKRLNQIIVAIISAVAGAIVTAIVAGLINL